MHIGITQLPAVVAFLDLVSPLQTSFVLLCCTGLHAYGSLVLLQSRRRINLITSQLRHLSPLGRRHKAMSTTPRRTRTFRFGSFFRLRLHPAEVAPDLQAPRMERFALSWKARFVQVQMACEGAYARFFGPKGVFSRTGSLYEVRIFLRQAIAVPLQVYRGAKWSANVESPCVVLYGLVLALECMLVPPLIAWNFYKYADPNQRDQCRKLRVYILTLAIAFDLVLGICLPIAIVAPVLVACLRNPSILTNPTFDVYAVSVIKAFMVASLLELAALVAPLVLIAISVRSLHDAIVSTFLWESIVTAASPGSHFENLQRYLTLGDLDGRVPSKWLQRHGTTRHKKTRELNASSLFARLGHKSTGHFTPVLPMIQDSSPTLELLHHTLGYARDHVGRSLLFLGATVVGSVLGSLVLTIVLRASLTNECVGPTAPPYVACLLPLRPWRLGWDQVCVCQAVEILCPPQMTESLDEILTKLTAPDVRLLSLDACAFETAPRGLGQLQQLWGLRVRGAGWNATDPGLDLTTLRHLVYFQVRLNAWREVPSLLSRLPPHLFVLDVGEMALTIWPTWVSAAWTNVQQLILVSNHLTSLPAPLLGLSSLLSLDLTNNSILSLPSLPWSTWPQLSRLRLASNRLDAFPISWFTALPELSTLTLAENALRTCDVPPRSLRLYTLDGNPCCAASESFPACHSSCSPLCDAEYAASPICNAFCPRSCQACESASS
ncbi:hypothetical protein SDRG_09185 [Saprolegnia diclina VS20]|uniref:Uncharacterized protein n=1 Tax=Saprolegnia diclina (strain VS20) TaxID=1156394 RepID=T0QEM7_SAPDV|nr:hypothetical protein SDRG_09185 [Saprolegnia diclina VS20]EQC33201.1 hypothetical protein SDRG_09185 [Saprolegnia diclina VS20]|eukprot:XP_008613324.1 hypothetical protein SDRG_09185 [Saprolegnia diclina VS20]